MSNIDKVIKGLKECSLDDVDCKHCPYNGEHEKKFKYGCETIMQRDALKLLKEQQHQIWEYQELTEHLKDKQPQIVRCKDCKHWSAERINDFNKCKRLINVGVKNFATIGDWFCADGERKDDEYN